jgi:hypothetical protein
MIYYFILKNNREAPCQQDGLDGASKVPNIDVNIETAVKTVTQILAIEWIKSEVIVLYHSVDEENFFHYI